MTYDFLKLYLVNKAVDSATALKNTILERYLTQDFVKQMWIAKHMKGEYDRYASGSVPLTLNDSVGKDLVSWSMVGNTVQDGTPSPENPVDVQGVGDWDETEQKYKIPVKTNDTTTNIYLNSTLMQGETLSSEGEREVEWKKIVLTGDEIYTPVGSYQRFSFKVLDFKSPAVSETANIKSDILKTTTKNALYQNVYAISSSDEGSSSMMIRLGADYDTKEKVKAWVSEHNVTLWYKSTNATIETFTPPTIPTQSGTTVIDTDCVVAPSSVTAQYKSSKPDNTLTAMMNILSEV